MIFQISECLTQFKACRAVGRPHGRGLRKTGLEVYIEQSGSIGGLTKTETKIPENIITMKEMGRRSDTSSCHVGSHVMLGVLGFNIELFDVHIHIVCIVRNSTGKDSTAL